jgi:hypothetical protein
MIMTRPITLLLVLVLLLAACRREHTAPAPEHAEQSFGEAVAVDRAVPVRLVSEDPEMYLDAPVTVEGTVREVCQAAGCWLTLDAGDGAVVRVVVARTPSGDYAFTVPKDISGRHVVVQGTLSHESLSADDRRHLAEDAGATQEALDAQTFTPARELQLIASGVVVEA